MECKFPKAIKAEIEFASFDFWDCGVIDIHEIGQLRQGLTKCVSGHNRFIQSFPDMQ